jgi:hypothetical protein
LGGVLSVSMAEYRVTADLHYFTPYRSTASPPGNTRVMRVLAAGAGSR